LFAIEVVCWRIRFLALLDVFAVLIFRKRQWPSSSLKWKFKLLRLLSIDLSILRTRIQHIKIGYVAWYFLLIVVLIIFLPRIEVWRRWNVPLLYNQLLFGFLDVLNVFHHTVPFHFSCEVKHIHILNLFYNFQIRLIQRINFWRRSPQPQFLTFHFTSLFYCVLFVFILIFHHIFNVICCQHWVFYNILSVLSGMICYQ
jgi:hypothetical protein